MDPLQEQLDALRDIRNMMDQSKKFNHLSGKSGIWIGTLALATVGFTYYMLDISPTTPDYYKYLVSASSQPALRWKLIGLYSLLLIIAGWISYHFALKNAMNKGIPAMTPAFRQLVSFLMYPLVTGGLFCLLLLYYHLEAWLAPVTLIFYGLALLNAGHFSFPTLRYFGIGMVLTGLCSAYFLSYALLGWAFGFGLLHIIFGIYIYFRYER
jgi:lipid-A-disaccharide synthase-like uncharacterized protein